MEKIFFCAVDKYIVLEKAKNLPADLVTFNEKILNGKNLFLCGG